MTGIGIVLFILAFLLSLRRYTKQYRLKMDTFMKHLPIYLIFIYLASSYARYFFESFVIIPLNFQQLLLYFSPHGYPFHLIGIVAAFLLIGFHILSKIEHDHQFEKWVDALLHSVCIACIPLGIFLLLGDNFIGAATDTNFYITAMRSDSNLAVYGKVLPLGLFLSLRGLISHVLFNIYSHKKKRYVSYRGYAVFCLGLLLLTLLQQYPRHLVYGLGTITFDIKQYFLLAVSIGLLLLDSLFMAPHDENEDIIPL